MKALRVFLSAAVCVACHTAYADEATAAADPELHVRSGLPHLAARVRDSASAGEFHVAYLGGSITAAGNGWRTLTTEHLRTLLPKLTVVEISAGLPGTGSNLGACRIGYDVLRHHPDLLFVEFAVNDTGVPPDRIERTMEGIVRQTWRENSATDICFVYTVSTPGLPALQAGEFPPAARAMENVAAHYGIPSIHLGVEIVHRLADGRLDFKPAPTTETSQRSPVREHREGTARTPQSVPLLPQRATNENERARSGLAPDSARTFSIDGVHPTAAGHRIYADVIARSLPALLSTQASNPHVILPPLHPDNWENASLLLLDSTTRTGKWIPVSPDDPNLRGATKNLLPPTWRTATAGATMTFEFRGRSFGLLGIAAPDSGEFRVTVDDLPPVTATFFDAYVSPTFCRQREWFFPTELADAPHRVRVELLSTALDKAAIKAKAGKPIDDPAPYSAHTLTLCGALIIGSPLP